MMKFSDICILLMLGGALFLTACGVNGYLTVYNKTDKNVSIYYETEDDTDEVSTYIQNVRTIGPGNKRHLEVDIDLTGEGSVKAVYGGIVRNITIDFGFDEEAKLYLYTDDFYDYILGL